MAASIVSLVVFFGVPVVIGLSLAIGCRCLDLPDARPREEASHHQRARGRAQAAMMPGAAIAQDGVEGTTTFADNGTCRTGQEVAWSLPPCEQDPETGILTIPFVNPEMLTGPFDGAQVKDGVLAFDTGNGDFSYTARALFMGTVEACGTGTIYFEVRGEGNHADGVSTFASNTYTTVSGGTLPLVGSLDMSGAEAVSDDGIHTLGYTGSYSCDSE